MFRRFALPGASQPSLTRDHAQSEIKSAVPESDNQIAQAGLRKSIDFPGENIWVAVILLLHLALSIGFSVGPLWEGPDEIAHYKFVRYLAERHNLPVPPYEAGTGGETHQAPLYYLINALFAQSMPDGDFDQRVGRGNPYHGVEAGIASNFNKNSRFHYAIEAFPYTQSETTLALHLLRLSSVLYSLGATALSYLVFKRLWPNRADLRILAFGITAFWPQNLYMSGTLNNDNLVLLAGVMALLWLLRQSDEGPSWVRTVCLGVALGLGLLAKSSMAFLVLPVGAAMLLDRRTWRTLPLLALVVILAGGWWYIRNMVVYGEPTGYTLFYQFVPAARIPLGTMSFLHWVGLAPNIYIGSWANFGDGAVGVGREMYVLYDLLLVLMLVGTGVWIWRAWQKKRQGGLAPEGVRRGLIIGLYTIAWFAAVGYIGYTSKLGVSGRVILPAVPGMAVLMAVGITSITPERLRMRLALSMVALMTFVATVCLVGYFRLSYRPEAVPAQIETPLSYHFQDQAEIIGTQSALIKARPGAQIRVFVYWRALGSSKTELMTFLHALESKQVRVDSFPGSGNLMSTEWQAGQTWAEDYKLSVPANAKPQTVLTLTGGLYDPESEEAFTAVDANGAETLPVVARVAINGPEAKFEPDYRLGQVIGLANPAVERQGESVKVCLKWLSIAPVTTDYHVFVHVLSEQGKLLGQSDAEPKGGAYPTSAWAPGEAIEDCVTVDAPGLPETGWRVAVGMYDFTTQARLPVVDRGGATQADNAVVWKP